MLSVDHVVYPAYDAARTLAFYRDLLGFPLVASHSGDDWGGYPWLMMLFGAGDGREIVMVALKGAKRPKSALPKDSRHLALAEKTVAGLKAWQRKFEAAGLPYWEESHGRQRSLYFEDPNGLIVEITAPPSKPAKASRQAEDHAESWIARA